MLLDCTMAYRHFWRHIAVAPPKERRIRRIETFRPFGKPSLRPPFRPCWEIISRTPRKAKRASRAFLPYLLLLSVSVLSLVVFHSPFLKRFVAVLETHEPCWLKRPICIASYPNCGGEARRHRGLVDQRRPARLAASQRRPDPSEGQRRCHQSTGVFRRSLTRDTID